MKRKILSLLILSFMVVSSIAPILGKNEDIQTSITTIKMVELKAKPKPIELKTFKSPIEIASENAQKELKDISSISDKKEWFIAYKTIINKYSYILDRPETIYDYYTNEELSLLFGVVQAEVGDEYTFEQKCNVASVILNRIEHYKFSDEMFEVLTSDQFETIRNGSYKNVEISDDTILACSYAFEIEDTTDGCLFFDSNKALDYKFMFNDGAHNFYKLKGEE